MLPVHSSFPFQDSLKYHKGKLLNTYLYLNKRQVNTKAQWVLVFFFFLTSKGQIHCVCKNKFELKQPMETAQFTCNPLTLL